MVKTSKEFLPQGGIVLGSDGQMGKFLMPYLRNHCSGEKGVVGLDMNGRYFNSLGTSIEDRRKAVGNAFNGALSIMDPEHRDPDLVIVSALPEDVLQNADVTTLAHYHKTERARVRAALHTVAGVKGTGRRNTTTLFLDSLQHHAAKVLNGMAGPVIGVHQMHGPSITDLSKEGVILGVTPEKSQHHRYLAAKNWTLGLLQNMGYAQEHIAQMSVEQHDKLMSNIQFLSHTHFLVLAQVIRKYMASSAVYNAEKLSLELQEILLMSQRILSGKSHVYRNIAQHNPHNTALFEQWTAALKAQTYENIGAVTQKFARITDQIGQEYLDSLHIPTRDVRIATTPVSRVRDGISARLNTLSTVDRMQDLTLTQIVMEALEDYRQALRFPEKYDAFFGNLQTFFPDRSIAASNPVIAKYS